MKKRHISALAAALALLLSLSTANATPSPRGNDPFCDNGDNFKYYTFIDDSKEKTDGDWVFRHRRGQELQPIVDYDAWCEHWYEHYGDPEFAKHYIEENFRLYGKREWVSCDYALPYEYLGEEQTDYIVFPDEFSAPDIEMVFKTGMLYKFKNSEKVPYIIFNNVNRIFEHCDIQCKGLIFRAPSMEIEKTAFYDSQTLEHIELSSQCTIGGKAFANSTLKEIIFAPPQPDSKLELKSNAFLNCKNLTHIDLPEPERGIELYYNVFEGSGLKDITIPPCIETVTTGTFLNCKDLESAVIEGDPQLEDFVFEGCDSLKEITFTGTPSLMNYALSECAAENINITLTDKTDGRRFDRCRNLMSFNGETVVNEDGSLKKEYEDYIRSNFRNSQDIGFLNRYVSYRVKNAVEETVSDNMSDMEKLKAIHDKICSMVYYDKENIQATKNHTDVSVFFNESSVCEGYSRAMNLMLHEAGINSCYVSTDDHAWVIVELGGHYFHVDTTWDDGDTVTYDWFLKADDDIRDDPMHKGWKPECPSSMHSFQWKEMPECTEHMGDVNSDGIVDARDASSILSSYAKASSGDKPQTDTVLSDCNFDGKTDARDASIVLKQYSQESAE